MKELWGRNENTRVSSTCFGGCLWDKYQALDPTVAVVPSRVGTKQPICRRNIFSIQRDVQSFTLTQTYLSPSAFRSFLFSLEFAQSAVSGKHICETASLFL